MRPRVSIAAPLAVLVLVSSALASTLDCAMHRDHDDQAVSGQPGPAPRHGEAHHSAGYGKRIGHQEGGPGSHDDDHRSGSACCHATQFGAASLSLDGREALQAAASVRRPHGFVTFVLPSVLASRSLVLSHGAGPPGPSGSSARLFPGRQLFLAVSSLLL